MNDANSINCLLIGLKCINLPYIIGIDNQKVMSVKD